MLLSPTAVTAISSSALSDKFNHLLCTGLKPVIMFVLGAFLRSHVGYLPKVLLVFLKQVYFLFFFVWFFCCLVFFFALCWNLYWRCKKELCSCIGDILMAYCCSWENLTPLSMSKCNSSTVFMTILSQYFVQYCSHSPARNRFFLPSGSY